MTTHIDFSFNKKIIARLYVVTFSLVFGWSCKIYGQSLQDLQTDEWRRAEDRLRQIQAQQPKSPDIRLEEQVNPATKEKVILPIEETPHFLIRYVELTGDDASRFYFALNAALVRTGLDRKHRETGKTLLATQKNNIPTLANEKVEGVLLGAMSINALMTEIQNIVIEHGYTTTRVLAEPQDLKTGVLRLTVIPGRVRHVRFDLTDAENSFVHRASSFNAFPISKGDILNLRDIEQGLENLKRVPTVEADIQIVPAETPNESDLVISWRQRAIPFRLTFSIDDTGSRSTGKYQGNITFSADNPLRINDLFYASYGRALKGYDATPFFDDEGKPTGNGHGKTRNWSLHYSVPFGYFLLAFNASGYDYDQLVLGANQTYNYSGYSRTQDLKLSWLFHRDTSSKSTVHIKGWSRFSNNFIDGTEMTVQRRKTAGYEISLTHKQYIQSATLDFSLAYKRGTGARKAIPAPEELFDEGTSRMKIITVDAGINLPFKLADFSLGYNSSFHGQWNKTPLIQIDRLSIGSRSTVRGFDGYMTLAGERGWYLRNELSWVYFGAHQFYVGVDIGRVSGASTENMKAKTLAGAAIGFRGAFQLGGSLQYDLFAGKPIYKPEGFVTHNTTFGFYVSYSF